MDDVTAGGPRAGAPALSRINTRENLARLLDRLGEHPEDPQPVMEEIRETFSQERAILILDMSGFTRTTQRSGIIPFLLMIHQMQRLALPSVEQHGGLLLRADADNLTCLFDTVEAAIEASRDITGRLNSANVILPAEQELYVSIGIGWGEILNVANESIYGNEVNLTSKIGEDIAQRGEILLTSPAYEKAGASAIDCERKHVSVSGVEIEYYVLKN